MNFQHFILWLKAPIKMTLILTMIKKAVIPVAGFGTRFLPASKAIPKEMLTIVDRPAIDYVVQEAIAAGIEHIILVTHASKTAIENYFDRHAELEQLLTQKNKPELLERLQVIPSHIQITSVRQGQALGLGHAIYAARHLIEPDEAFAVLLPDVLIAGDQADLKQMMQDYDRHQAAQVMVETVDANRVDQYGIVDVRDELQPGQSIAMQGIVEKPALDQAPSQLAVVGRYILPGQIMQILADTPAGQGAEIQLTDAIAQLDQVDAYLMQGQSFDCGSPLGYLKAIVHHAHQHPTFGAAFRELIKHYNHE